MRTRVHWLVKGLSQVALDILVFAVAVVAAYFMRFEGVPPAEFLRQMLILLPL
jgi:hypothetical protein